MGRRLRSSRFEWIIPDFEDNLALAKVGQTDDVVAVELRRPSAGVWRQYQQAIAEARQRAALAQGVPLAEVAMPALLPDVEGALFRACLGRFRNLDGPDGTPIPDGAALWGMRDTVEEGRDGLLGALFLCIFDAASYDAALVGNFGSLSGSWERSQSGDDGSAPIAAPVASA